MKRTPGRFTLVVGLLLAAAGCMDADSMEEEEAVPTLDDNDDDAVFTETLVEIGPDGAVHSESRPITVRAEREQNARKAAAIGGGSTPWIHQDALCQFSSFWLYSGVNLTGDRICFRGSDYVDLAEYVRWTNVNGGGYIRSWVLTRGSYSPGSLGGVLFSSGGGPTIRFDIWGPARSFYAPAGATYRTLGLLSCYLDDPQCYEK